MKYLLTLALISWPLAGVNYQWGTRIRLDNGASTLRVVPLRNGVQQPGAIQLSLPLASATYQRVTFWPAKYRGFQSEFSCSSPCELSMPLHYGGVKYFVEYFDGANQKLRESEWYTLDQVSPLENSFTLPVEVIGFAPFSRRLPVAIQGNINPSNPMRLWARTHRIGYPDKARVRLNNNTWLPIRRDTVTLLRDARNWTFTSLEFGQQTLEWTMALPNGAVLAGANQIEWQYWRERKEQSGYRVLEFNFLEADLAVSSIAIASGIATLTTSAPHGYQSGDDILLIDFPGIAWRLNGKKTNITVTGPNTFTFPAGNSPVGTWNYPGVFVARMAIDVDSFVTENPTTWQAPAGGDVQAGAAAFSANNLWAPDFPGQRITASCADCHTLGARDLKYFNYSNWSNIVRSQFHGLSEQTALDIAAYVRANPSPAPGRPWNPPYQPCPEADTVDPMLWSGTCSVDDVLPYDTGMYEGLFGASVDANDFSPTMPDSFHWRNQRISIQLLDWNDWLPRIHPKDAYNRADLVGRGNYPYWPQAPMNLAYQELRQAYTGKCPTPSCAAENNGLNPGLVDWYVNRWNAMNGKNMTGYQSYIGGGGGPCQGGYPSDFDCPGVFTNETNQLAVIGYSTALWAATKVWELVHDFDLARYGTQFYPRAGTNRIIAWRGAFAQSPNLLRIIKPSAGSQSVIPGIHDGLPATEKLVSMQWYQLAAILNPNGNICCPSGFDTIGPLDVGYTHGYFKDLYYSAGLRLPFLTTQWIQQNFRRLRNNTPSPGGEVWSWRGVDLIAPILLTNRDFTPFWSVVPESDRPTMVAQIVEAASKQFTDLVGGYTANGSAPLFTPAMWNQFESSWTTINLGIGGFESLGRTLWQMLTYGKAWGLSFETRNRIATEIGPALIYGRNIALSAPINATQTSIPLAVPFDFQRDILIRIGSEEVRCTSGSGSNVLSACTRGFNSTSAAAANAGTAARQVIRWVTNGLNSTCAVNPATLQVENCDGVWVP